MKRKISEMIGNYAGAYIAMGTNIEDRKNYLRSACTAWNIACIDDKENRDKMTKKYLNEYKRYNSDCDKEDLIAFKENLTKLINEKLKMFPYEKATIINCNIKVVDKTGKEEIIIASLRQC